MNFGHKILITFIAFALLMGTLIYMSLQTEFELVSKEYYKDELAYQQVIDASDNAKALRTAVNVSQENGSLLLQLPAEMKGKATAGEVYFYCAADSRKDRRFPLQADSNGIQVFETGTDILPGTYRIKLSWNTENIPYYNETYFVVK